MINPAFREQISSFRGFPGLYIHIPFCREKCSYCDFYSLPYSEKKKGRFLSALNKEILFYGKLLSPLKLKTVYIGGGTPSLLTPAEVGTLLEHIRTTFSFPLPAEITLEANPACITPHKIQNYRKIGITRLSLGIQSFFNSELNLLGRQHSAAGAEEAIEAVSRYFDNYSLDFIFALPGQTAEKWEWTLEKALSFNPP
ncbi:MAG: coproporphyrinogen-III oxidase family protein, partial [Halanaerobiales bacterium]